MNNSRIEVPVLLIGFNRPEIIKQSFEYIRKARPEKLYVAIDGPRAYVADDVELINKVRNIVQNVDWPCEKYYKFNETNQGAEITVSSAITWVLNKEEYVIILEDDIISPLSFFKFAQEMLIRYENDERIGIISGNNFTPIKLKGDEDYFFAKYAHSWGWATWKRVWDQFDLNIEVDKKHLKRKFLKSISNSRAEANFYKHRYKSMRKRGAGNTPWDVTANYISRIKHRINIIPRVNLTSNIGIYGVHARGKSVFHNLKCDEDFIVRKHPDIVEINVEYDKFHFNEHIRKYQKSVFTKVIRKISKYFLKKDITKMIGG